MWEWANVSIVREDEGGGDRGGWTQPLSISALAKLFGCDRKTMRGWLTSDLIPKGIACKFGTRYQVRRDRLPHDAQL